MESKIVLKYQGNELLKELSTIMPDIIFIADPDHKHENIVFELDCIPEFHANLPQILDALKCYDLEIHEYEEQFGNECDYDYCVIKGIRALSIENWITIARYNIRRVINVIYDRIEGLNEDVIIYDVTTNYGDVVDDICAILRSIDIEKLFSKRALDRNQLFEIAGSCFADIAHNFLTLQPSKK